MKETGERFGVRLARMRQEAGLSQQALAERLNVTRQAVSNWEREQTVPDLDMLRAIARVLGTDLNTLGDGPMPAPVRRKGNRWAVALAACLCVVCVCGGALWLGGRGGGPAASPQTEEKTGEAVAPHKVRYVTPNGVTVIAPADGFQELYEQLAALSGTETGPVELTAELGDTISYFAEQYELRYAPEYAGAEEGFASWDQVLFWLYKVGISRGAIMTQEEVEDAVVRLFGDQVQVTHQGTDHFPLTQEGYYPVDVTTAAGAVYQLLFLDRLEDGAYQLGIQEKGGAAVTLTLELREEGAVFRSIVRDGGQEA